MSPTALALALITVAAATVFSVSVITSPVFECEDLKLKVTDFANQDKMRALDLCTSLGGEVQPSSGVPLVASLVFFGAGGSLIVVSRRDNSIRQAPSDTTGDRVVRPSEPPGIGDEGITHLGTPRVDPVPSNPPRSPQLPPAKPITAEPPNARADDTPSPFTVQVRRTLEERLVEARPASFGNRAPAFLIDLLAITVLAFTAMLLVQIPFGQEQREGAALGTFYIFAIPVTFIGYHWISATAGGSPGMRIFGMRVIPVGSAAVSGMAALWRAVILFFGCLILVGPFSGLWHKEGRAWHDLASGTGVVHL